MRCNMSKEHEGNLRNGKKRQTEESNEGEEEQVNEGEWENKKRKDNKRLKKLKMGR